MKQEEKRREVNMSTKSSKSVQHYKIPEGGADIARLLGVRPDSAVYDYNVILPLDSGLVLPDWTLGVAQQGITPLARGGAKAVTMKMPEGMVRYQQENIGVGEIIEASSHLPVGPAYRYPEDSVHKAMSINNGNNIASELHGSTFIPAFSTYDLQQVAEQINGDIICTPEQALVFNSKVRVFRQAQSYNYNVAPFEVADNAKSVEDALGRLKRQLESRFEDFDAEEAKYWVKFDSLAGGTGVMDFRPHEQDLDEISRECRNVVENCYKGYTDREIERAQQSSSSLLPENMPILIDLDVGSIPDVKEVLRNVNVQAVCGQDGVYLTGATYQNTDDDGTYIGGVLPRTEEERRDASLAQEFAVPALEAAWDNGYRGYAGIDVLLCQTYSAGVQGFILEMNGRINSSTSLLHLAHWMEKQSGHNNPVAMNISLAFGEAVDYKKFEEIYSDLLFRGAETDWTGIVPIIAKPSGDGDKLSGIKTIALSPDDGNMKNLQQEITKREKYLNGGPG